MASSAAAIYHGYGQARHPLYMVASTGRRVPLDRLPRGFGFGEVAETGAVEVEGFKPRTVVTGPGLRTLSLTTVIGNTGKGRAEDIEARLDAVLYFARHGKPFRLSGAASPMEQRGWWIATGAEVNVTHRNAQHRAARAEIEWDLVEHVPESSQITYTHRNKDGSIWRPPVRKATPAPSGASVKNYTVRSGDYLWRIAARQLGKGNRWREIYNLNKNIIPNPARLRVGQVLKVPVK